MKVKIKQSDLIKTIRLILEEESNEVIMTPQEYKELLPFVNYNGALITKIKEYRGKNIVINGNLDISNLPVKSISGVSKVLGTLNINGTNISSLDGTEVSSYTQYWNTPLKRKEDEAERRKILASADLRREDKEWDDESSDIGNKARALLKYLSDSDNVVIKTEEDNQRLSELEARLEDLEKQESDMYDEGRDTTDIVADIEVINDEIEEIKKRADIYNLIPYGSHYDMSVFQLWGTDHDESNEYAVGTESEVEDACENYVEGLIDEGEQMFQPNYLQYFIDEQKVREDAESDYDYLVRESPESYFNEDEYELSPEQEEEKEELEAKIAALEERKEQWEEYQNRLDKEIEEPRDYSNAYDKVQEQIDQIDEEIENIQEVIDDLKADGPTEDQIQNKIDELTAEAVSDPVQYLKDRGLDLIDWVDKEELAQAVIRDNGYGMINGYDGSYDTVYYNGTEYYIMRIN